MWLDLRTIVTIAEITVTLIGSIYYYKYRNTRLKYFLAFLYLMVLFDNKSLIFDISITWHYVLSNLFNVLMICFFMWLFKIYILKHIRKRIIEVFTAIYIVAILISAISDGFNTTYAIAHLIGAIFVILSIMYFAIDLFGRKELYKLEKDLLLWIGVGYLVYFISFPVIQTARLYFVTNKELFSNLQTILVSIIVLMYAIISFGFIYSDKKIIEAHYLKTKK